MRRGRAFRFERRQGQAMRATLSFRSLLPLPRLELAASLDAISPSVRPCSFLYMVGIGGALMDVCLVFHFVEVECGWPVWLPALCWLGGCECVFAVVAPLGCYLSCVPCLCCRTCWGDSEARGGRAAEREGMEKPADEEQRTARIRIGLTQRRSPHLFHGNTNTTRPRKHHHHTTHDRRK